MITVFPLSIVTMLSTLATFSLKSMLVSRSFVTDKTGPKFRGLVIFSRTISGFSLIFGSITEFCSKKLSWRYIIGLSYAIVIYAGFLPI